MPDPLLLILIVARLAGGAWLVALGLTHRRTVIVGLGAGFVAHAVPGVFSAFDHQPTLLLRTISSGAAATVVGFSIAATINSRTEILSLRADRARASSETGPPA